MSGHDNDHTQGNVPANELDYASTDEVAGEVSNTAVVHHLLDAIQNLTDAIARRVDGDHSRAETENSQ